MSKQKRSFEIAGNKFSIHSSCSDQKEQLTNLINCAGGSVVEALETADYLIIRLGKHRGGLGNVLQKYSQLSAIEIDDLYAHASEKGASPSNLRTSQATLGEDTPSEDSPSEDTALPSNIATGARSTQTSQATLSEDAPSEDNRNALPITRLAPAEAWEIISYGFHSYMEGIAGIAIQTRLEHIDETLEELKTSVAKIEKASQFLGETYMDMGKKLLD
eukprot:TRINITY_DN404_c0_g1_i4.p1 TRINITY_DN404_c0_g1~~TRINITY_DN404_c0_g1_i4.p1  ORF type:complete len:218 (-),score=34.56 TRINITY_DN404_c0_g1_i4:59-712(-)